MEQASILSFHEFTRQLGDIINSRFTGALRGDLLFDELCVDSLEVFELVVVSEALAGARPEGALPAMYSMGDLYDYYGALATSSHRRVARLTTEEVESLKAIIDGSAGVIM